MADPQYSYRGTGSTDSAPIISAEVLRSSQWEYLPDENLEHAGAAPVRSVVRELLETAISVLLIFCIARGMIQQFKIEGSSMEPNLHNGQYILVNKLGYFHFDATAPLRLFPGRQDTERRIIYPFHMPQRGDIVVLEYPRDLSKDYIKRVIGLPGERIEIKEGNVFVNGVRLDEPYIEGGQTACRPEDTCSTAPVTVPPDGLFVMGDNRNNSSDSREWGILPLDHVVGQAWFIYYPVSDWGSIAQPSYALPQTP